MYRKSNKTFQRIGKSIKLDTVQPQDLRKYQIQYACEQCCHFSAADNYCTMGYNPTKHRQRDQLRTYELTGKMAFCRFMEID